MSEVLVNDKEYTSLLKENDMLWQLIVYQKEEIIRLNRLVDENDDTEYHYYIQGLKDVLKEYKKENNKLYELIDRIVNSISNKYDGLTYEKLNKIAEFIGDELKNE